MVSLTEYAFRALMGSNVNPSQFLPRSVDHQGSTGENGAVVLAGEDSEYYFRGLNVLNGEKRVKGGNAIETARFLAKLSSLGAIILFATPIDTVVDVAALTYYSFKWVKSAALQHTEERKIAFKNLSNRFSQLCVHVTVLFAVIFGSYYAKNKAASDPGAFLSPRVNGLVAAIMYSMFIGALGASSKLGLNLFVAPNKISSVSGALLLKEFGGIESKNGGLVQLDAKEGEEVQEKIREEICFRLIETIGWLQSIWQDDSPFRILFHYPPSQKTIADFYKSKDNLSFKSQQIEDEYLEALHELRGYFEQLRQIDDFTLPFAEKAFPISEEVVKDYFEAPFVEFEEEQPDSAWTCFERLVDRADHTEKEKELAAELNKYVEVTDFYGALDLKTEVEKYDTSLIKKRFNKKILSFHPDKLSGCRQVYAEWGTFMFRQLKNARAHCLCEAKRKAEQDT